MRLFVALELDEGSRGQLARVVDALREIEPGMRWTCAQNLHLTLRFLGEVEDRRLPAVARALEEAAGVARGAAAGAEGRSEALPARVRRTGAPRLEACGLAFQPAQGRVRLIAAELAGEIGELRELHGHLEEALSAAGLGREDRRLWPHVTLGRCRRPLPARRRVELPLAVRHLFPGPGWRAPRLVLMQSTLVHDGPRYVVVASTPLATA